MHRQHELARQRASITRQATKQVSRRRYFARLRAAGATTDDDGVIAIDVTPATLPIVGRPTKPVAHRRMAPRRGRAPRRATNARRRGSRRASTPTRGSPGGDDPSEPEPGERAGLTFASPIGAMTR